jgi:L-fuculose-phosphate aldolase
LAGQISARGARSETFYTQRMGLGFDEIRASTLLLVDEDLNVLAGDGIPNPANRFHAWIYRAYPATQCVIHTHPFHVSAFAMLEQPLVIAHMDTCLLHDDCAFLPQWPGLPFGNDEGAIIAAALGGKRALLMGHHGQLAAGRSVMEACLIAMAMERAARLQLAAQPAGRIVPIPASLATEAHDWLLHPDRVAKVFTLWARRALRSHADCLS